MDGDTIPQQFVFWRNDSWDRGGARSSLRRERGGLYDRDSMNLEKLEDMIPTLKAIASR